MLFSAINYPLCFWEGTRKNYFLPGVVVAQERGWEKLLLAGASVMKTLLFGNVTPAAPIEVSKVPLGKMKGPKRPGSWPYSQELL